MIKSTLSTCSIYSEMVSPYSLAQIPQKKIITDNTIRPHKLCLEIYFYWRITGAGLNATKRDLIWKNIYQKNKFFVLMLNRNQASLGRPREQKRIRHERRDRRFPGQERGRWKNLQGPLAEFCVWVNWRGLQIQPAYCGLALEVPAE